MKSWKMALGIMIPILLILIAGGLDLKNVYLEWGIGFIMTMMGALGLILLGKKLRDEEIKRGE